MKNNSEDSRILDHDTDSTSTFEPDTDSTWRVSFCEESSSLYISQGSVVNEDSEADNTSITEQDDSRKKKKIRARPRHRQYKDIGT